MPLRREPLLVGPGEKKDVGDLTLVAGAMLAGRVVDEQGGPLPGARVEAKPLGKPAAAHKTSTDGKGEFYLRLPLGSYALAAQTQKLALPSPRTIELRSDVATDDCILQLTAKR